MLVSLCSRAARSSWDRVGVGLVDRPQNHKYSIFQQGGLAAARDRPKNGCYHLAGAFASFLPPVWRCIDQAGVGLEMHLGWGCKMMMGDGKGKLCLDHVQHSLIKVG